jgi:hypothetical protein
LPFGFFPFFDFRLALGSATASAAAGSILVEPNAAPPKKPLPLLPPSPPLLPQLVAPNILVIVGERLDVTTLYNIHCGERMLALAKTSKIMSTMPLFVLPLLALCTAEVHHPQTTGGLTLTRFSNTALAGAGSSEVVTSVDAIKDCAGSNCRAPSSFKLTGRIAPPAEGNYGFNITTDPPTPYPSSIAYARLWVDDHLLFPPDTQGKKHGGGVPYFFLPHCPLST